MVAVSDLDGQEEDISERMLGRVLVDGEHTSTTSSTAVESDSSTMATNTGKESRRRAPRKRQAAAKTTAIRKSKTVAKTTPPRRIHSTRAVTRSAGPSVELFRGIEEVTLPPKQPKAPREDNNSNVVKVPMLTGILYLYREKGCKRRAKFVRTK